MSRDSFRLVGVRLTQLLSALVAPLNVLWNYVISFLWTPGERRRADGGADNSGREYSSGAAYSGTRYNCRSVCRLWYRLPCPALYHDVNPTFAILLLYRMLLALPLITHHVGDRVGRLVIRDDGDGHHG